MENMNSISSEIKNLMLAQARCIDATNIADQVVGSLQTKLESAQHDLEKAIGAGLRSGDSTGEIVAREACRTLLSEVAAARERGKIAGNEVTKLEFELLQARARLRTHLRSRATEMSDEIQRRIASDKKLRPALIESIILHYVADAPGAQINWAGHLEDVFPYPGDDEFAAAVPAARARLGIRDADA